VRSYEILCKSELARAWMSSSFLSVCPHAFPLFCWPARPPGQTITLSWVQAPCFLTWLRVAGHFASGASRWATHHRRQFPGGCTLRDGRRAGTAQCTMDSAGAAWARVRKSTSTTRHPRSRPLTAFQPASYNPFRWPFAKVIASYFVPEKQGRPSPSISPLSKTCRR
jgi:hypothetical protein